MATATAATNINFSTIAYEVNDANVKITFNFAHTLNLQFKLTAVNGDIEKIYNLQVGTDKLTGYLSDQERSDQDPTKLSQLNSGAYIITVYEIYPL